ncbi:MULTISPECIES: HTH-type transcriptional repressor FabR [Alkalimonas]|uniref:HTH-type transcriptional repressor FabR n=1 Tax=Alkalimonas mucilaginosa TaxID=3057676 RepID=A0ABU7JEW9_9GAMM|nr:HTH-type transcriptional repressor FabR [Alkalimonas sp. MEB004]MEE2024236.1 HTH-type transcriptional repressor FabR [Alkalimonas sp. MEB004]
MSRAEQKEKTRRAIINAAFQQLSADKSFASLSLREVAREAGIAPTSFYRHFSDMDALGLTLVDEAGLMLRQLMRQARQRIVHNRSVIQTSVETFMEFIIEHSNVFRLLLRERSGTSAAFRSAVAREIQHFCAELADYLRKENKCSAEMALIQAEAMVILVFHAGADALDASDEVRQRITIKTIQQLRWLAGGSKPPTV